MPENIFGAPDRPLDLDMVRDELGRFPVTGRESDRELFADLSLGGLETPPFAAARRGNEREFLANDFTHGP
jgi:hypothetical protein